MANKKKGHLTTSGEWAKHLRKFLKRKFWKAERAEERVQIKREAGHGNYIQDGTKTSIKNL